jgi:hypothetical protein
VGCISGVLLVSRWLCLVSFVGAFVWVLLWVVFLGVFSVSRV